MLEVLIAIFSLFAFIFILENLFSFIDIIQKGKKYDKDISDVYKKVRNELNENVKIKEVETFYKNEIIKLKNEIKNIKIENNQKIDLIRSERVKDRLYRFADYIVAKECETFDDLYVHLTCKDRPAYKAAEDVKRAKKITREFSLKYKQMKYEYDLLFSLFPELENYIEKESSFDTIDSLKDNYDYAQNWLSKEEYNKLSENERNQLALNRYIESRKKSKWQIGRDYELCIGYGYSEKGYDVKYFGIEKKLEDLGRDIIAENDKEILIIQCKYWSKEKTIHEKHICQLYGTATQYKKIQKTKKKIIPVLITNIKLSEMAKEFAKDLKVKLIENYETSEFPRIKCNIGKNKEKIYHLPFDQQYDNVIIEKEKGEFFAWSVDEAVKNGYRRAKKWLN